jgi:hypothetical protein
MPKLDLPAAITAYVNAANIQDADTVVRCFVDDAVVLDEGVERRGATQVRAWAAEVSRKYHPVLEPLSVAATPAGIVVVGRVTGNFPGSPIDLHYTFELAGQKIQRLEVMP